MSAVENARRGIPRRLIWRELSPRTREALEGRLGGLYDQPDDEQAFDALAVDKQQALLILARRFLELDLWEAVRRVENVYGEGGVGMSFAAWPMLKSGLERRGDFTRRLAAHKGTSGGFMERGKTSAALHLLYVDGPERANGTDNRAHTNGAMRRWAAHFDFYNPWASPLSAWRHLLNEKLRGERPDWPSIGSALWDRGGEFYLTSV